MNLCLKCVMPDTRPDVPFTDGVCQACINYANRPAIDWEARKQELLDLLERHDGRCIVPSSGGKDSTYQVVKLLELGADVTVVTASTCYLTKIGRMNIDNLARLAPTIEVTPNRTVRAKLNKLGLTLVGDISHPEHMAIFTTPFRIAVQLGIPLIFFGENPQHQYGGPPGAEEARQLTERWRSEFGGFLGLRPADMVGQLGITERDMRDYTMPPSLHFIAGDGKGHIADVHVEAHFLGQYLPWDSHENARIAKEAGMVQGLPYAGNWWHHENIDNAMTGLHDHGMYRKFGFGRMASQMSVDIRAGKLTREVALPIIEARDGLFPFEYMGVTVDEVCDRIGMTREQLMTAMDDFTTWDLFDGVDANRPILKAA